MVVASDETTGETQIMPFSYVPAWGGYDRMKADVGMSPEDPSAINEIQDTEQEPRKPAPHEQAPTKWRLLKR